MKRVAAALIVKDGMILIAQRLEGDTLAGLWEFPGGKIEPGETPEQCVGREILEELGMNVTVQRHYQTVVHSYVGGQIELLAYWCGVNEDPQIMTSHSAWKWVMPTDLVQYVMAPADIPIAERLDREGIPSDLT